VKLHFFDVDFTIVRSSTVRAFIFRGLREGLISPSIGIYAPLLREIGEAVAVNPDGRLRRVARERGWEILTTVSGRKEAQYA
jgi:hypothetical protein